MICYECGSSNVVLMRKDVYGLPFGIENVIVKDCEVQHCNNCDADAQVIFAMTGLHWQIANALRRKRRRTEKEETFLAKVGQELPPLEAIQAWRYKRRGHLIEMFRTVNKES